MIIKVKYSNPCQGESVKGTSTLTKCQGDKYIDIKVKSMPLL